MSEFDGDNLDERMSRRAIAGVSPDNRIGAYANNDALRQFNAADSDAAMSRFAPSNSIASRFNPMSTGSAFRIQNPAGWEYLKQKYGEGGGEAMGNGANPAVARQIHDQAVAPSIPGMASAYDHWKDYSPAAQAGMAHTFGWDKDKEQMARLPASNPGGGKGSGYSIGDGPMMDLNPVTSAPPASPPTTAPASGGGLFDTIGKGLKSYFSTIYSPHVAAWNATKSLF